MAAITIPARRQWRSQPQRVLSADLSLGMTAAVAGRHGLLATGAPTPLTLAAGSASISPSVVGVGVTLSGGTNTITTPFLKTHSGPTAFTIEVLCAITTAPALAGFVSVPSATTGASRGLIAYGGTVGNRNIYFWGSSADLDSGIAWRKDGLPQHVFCVSEGTGQPMLFYRDGILVASGTTPGSPLADTTAANLFIGDTGAGWGSCPTGTIAIGAFYNRALTPTEVLLRTRAPWQLLKRQSRRIFVAASTGSYTLTAAQGSYSLTGQDVALLASRSLAAAQGSYTLTGQDAALLRLFTLTAAQGSYSLSGQAVALAASRLIAAGQGSYTLTGQAVGLLASWVLAAGQGAYALTGQAAGLTYTPLGSYSLLADAGSYTITGQSVGLLASRLLAAAAGSYSLSGQDVGLTYTPAGASYTLTADVGGYALTGHDIAFARTYVLTAASGSYTLTGRAVTFSYSGAPTATVQDMLRTARGVARLAARGAARNILRGYRP